MHRDEEDDTMLGKFKLEHSKITKAYILGRKCYAFEDNGEWKLVCKGVYKKTLTPEFFEELKEKGVVEQEFRNMFLRKFGYVVIHNTYKVISI